MDCSLEAAVALRRRRCNLGCFLFRSWRIVQEDDLPDAAALEQDVRFLVVFLRYLALRVTRAHLKEVAGDGGIRARTNLDVQIREGSRFYPPPTLNESRPILLVGSEVGAAFRQP